MSELTPVIGDANGAVEQLRDIALTLCQRMASAGFVASSSRNEEFESLQWESAMFMHVVEIGELFEILVPFVNQENRVLDTALTIASGKAGHSRLAYLDLIDCASRMISTCYSVGGPANALSFRSDDIYSQVNDARTEDWLRFREFARETIEDIAPQLDQLEHDVRREFSFLLAGSLFRGPCNAELQPSNGWRRGRWIPEAEALLRSDVNITDGKIAGITGVNRSTVRKNQEWKAIRQRILEDHIDRDDFTTQEAFEAHLSLKRVGHG